MNLVAVMACLATSVPIFGSMNQRRFSLARVLELMDPEEQRARFRAQLVARQQGDDESPVPDEDFCQALEYGLPPTIGWGMGIDRLVMLLSDQRHIRDVLSFPAVSSKLDT